MKPSTCTIEYTTTCSRTEYNEMTTTDTRVDRVTITLKAEENSRTSIQMNYRGGALYSSTSAKLISLVREWYVDEVKYRIYEKFTDGSDIINSEIKKNFSEPDKVVQANRDGAKLLAKVTVH